MLGIAGGQNIGWGVLHAVSHGSLPTGKWAFFRRLDDGSRMSREVHVRFCEQRRGKFPPLTLLLIFVRSRSAAQRVLRTVSRFIEGRLALIINRAKSKAARLRECTFLGFRMHRGKLRWTDAAVQTFRQRVREITDRHNGKSMRQRLEALRGYVVGWLNYFGHSRSYTELLELDKWLRRRVRLCYWKDWKRPRARRRHLLALGIPKDEVKLASRSSKGYWRMAGNSIVQRALTKHWLWDQGVPNMRQQWIDLHYPAPSGVA